MGTKENPGRFDCYASAKPHEAMFILLGRDKHSPLLVRLWARLRQLDGECEEKVAEAFACADAMEVYRQNQGKPAASIEEAFGILIAEEITRQHGEDNTDNLGDGESLLLLGFTPAINIAELVERIAGKQEQAI